MGVSPDGFSKIEDDFTIQTEEAWGNIDHTLTVEEIRKILHIDRQQDFSQFSENQTVGVGGVGAVFAVRDPVLNRMIAVKVLRPAYRFDSKYINNFVREARATAQIDHPNVIPVHQLSVLDDAGVCFSMKLVEGETLRSVLEHLDRGEKEYLQKFSLNLLLDVFLPVCNAVSFAHSKGILHRDLKPSNIMLGSFGEVLVMDWGMAKYRAEKDYAKGGQKINLESGISEAVTDEVKTQFDTHAGTLHGTPAFMAQEQALGLLDEVDERTDVYSLGAVLYSILTWKSSPFDSELSVDEILRKCANSDFLAPSKRTPERAIPVELEAICLKAMSGEKALRYATVLEMIQDIRNYRDNLPVSAYSAAFGYRILKACQRRPMLPFSVLLVFFTVLIAAVVITSLATMRGTPLLEVAKIHAAEGDAVIERAMVMVEERQNMLDDLGSEPIPYEKFRTLQNDISKADNEAYNRYSVALDLLSQLEGSGASLTPISEQRVEIFERQLGFMLAARQYSAIRDLMSQLNQRHKKIAGLLSVRYPEIMSKVDEITENNAYFTLKTDTGSVSLREMECDDDLGEIIATGTNFRLVLPAREYVAEVKLENGGIVNYPFQLNPGMIEESMITPPEIIPPDTVFVPGGYFNRGFELAPELFARQYIDDFFIGKNEVSLAEYREFLKSLGSESELAESMPLYVFSDSGRNFEPVFNQDWTLKSPFTPEMPVLGITVKAAKKYCEWYGEKNGFKCRLPNVAEWEKAARGIDGRTYVWGNSFNDDNALFSENTQLSQYPSGAPSGSFPKDKTVYGAFDMAGNVREFCLPVNNNSSAAGLVKGGSFNTSRFTLMCASSGYSYGNDSDVGFRILIEL